MVVIIIKSKEQVAKTNTNTADYSVPKSKALPQNGKALTNKIHNRIDNCSVLLVPARPASTQKGSVVKKEIDYARQQGKKIVAVDTGSTQHKSSYWEKHNIPVVANTKRSIENAINKPKARNE